MSEWMDAFRCYLMVWDCALHVWCRNWRVPPREYGLALRNLKYWEQRLCELYVPDAEHPPAATAAPSKP